MKVTQKKKDHKFVIWMFVIAALCCVITNASYYSGVSSFAASGFGVIVSPLQKLAAGAHAKVSEISDYFGDIKALKKENEALKNENTRLTRELSQLAPVKEENDRLYGFLELKKERMDIKFVNADIISRSSSNYTSDFTVDKGSVHGIKKNMPVMTEDGSILGIIIEVGATYSRGKTLTSYDYSIGIKNQRTGEPGILSGSFDYSKKNLCTVNDLSERTDYAVGDIIITSALGDIYPPGLYVGTVKELIPDKYGYTVSAVIEPSVTVQDTSMVMIVTDFDRAYEPVSHTFAKDEISSENTQEQIKAE